MSKNRNQLSLNMARILMLSFLFFILSCEVKEDRSNIEKEKLIADTITDNQRTPQDRVLDTILERTNPQHLDFSKNQLFIDTSRNSEFYEKIKNWHPSKFDNEATKYYIDEIREDYEFSLHSLRGFPRDWISLKIINGTPVLHDPCDGISMRFRLTETSVNSYAIESDVDAIHKVISKTHDEIEIELRTIKEKSEDQTATFSIKKSKLPYIYILQYNYGDWGPAHLVTPLKDIQEFDMVVNACTCKIVEGVDFDKLDVREFK